MEKNRHVALVKVQVTVHKVNENGECSGQNLPGYELRPVDLKPNYLFGIHGNTKEECLANLKEVIDAIGHKQRDTSPTKHQGQAEPAVSEV